MDTPLVSLTFQLPPDPRTRLPGRTVRIVATDEGAALTIRDAVLARLASADTN